MMFIYIVIFFCLKKQVPGSRVHDCHKDETDSKQLKNDLNSAIVPNENNQNDILEVCVFIFEIYIRNVVSDVI